MQFDDGFLEELGLGELPEAQRAGFLRHVYETLELRVGEALSKGMSDGQLEEFESIIDRDAVRIVAWVDAHVPNFLDDPLYAKMSDAMGPDVEHSELICEYAATKWLEVRRPDYRDVVAAALEDMKTEIRAHAAQLLDR